MNNSEKALKKNEELDQTDANFVHAGNFYGKLHSFFLGYFDDRKSTNYFYAFFFIFMHFPFVRLAILSYRLYFFSLSSMYAVGFFFRFFLLVD